MIITEPGENKNNNDCIDCGVIALFQCQAVLALVGQTVFHGRMYKAVHSVDFRLEFIVSGFDVMQVLFLCIVLFPLN